MLKDLIIIILILIIIGLFIAPVQTKTLLKATGNAVKDFGEDVAKKILTLSKDKVKEKLNENLDENEENT